MRLNYLLSVWGYEAYAEPKKLEDAVADAVRAGCGVEVWPSWREEKNLFGIENRERLVWLLQDIPSSLHGAGEVTTLEGHINQIEAARDTKSSVVVVHSYSLVPPELGRDYAMAREVVACAAEQGVTIALENDVRPGSLDDLAEALERVPGLGACLDVGHVFVAGDAPLVNCLRRLGRRIAHLHLQDVYLRGLERPGDSHRPPGQCDISDADWRLLLLTLRNIEYDGFAVIEVRPFTPGEIAAQVADFVESIEADRGRAEGKVDSDTSH